MKLKKLQNHMMLYAHQISLVIIKILELQYRGRLRELKNFVPVKDGESDLLKAMKQIAETGKGPQESNPKCWMWY